MLTSIFARDYPVVIALTALAFIMVMLGNLIADILYAIVDPRVRIDGSSKWWGMLFILF